MPDYRPTTMLSLIQMGVAGGIGAAIDKQLVRFQIATGHNDPDLIPKLSAADPALLSFLGDRLALALFNQP